MTIGDACHDAIRLNAKLSSEKAPVRPIGGRSAVRCFIRMEQPVERDLVVWEDTRCDRKMLRPRKGKEIRLDASRIASNGAVVRRSSALRSYHALRLDDGRLLVVLLILLIAQNDRLVRSPIG